jgi:hypothetical protein
MVVQVMKIWIMRNCNVDISSYSDDGSGNKDTSRYLHPEYIRDAISSYNEAVGREVFTWIGEGDHYHITCNIASKVIKGGETLLYTRIILVNLIQVLWFFKIVL